MDINKRIGNVKHISEILKIVTEQIENQKNKPN